MIVDHVAIEVGDFDTRLEFLTEALGLHLRRMGRLAADPDRRIAMLADERGTKVELVEGASFGDRLLHLAFDTGGDDAVDEVFDTLLSSGCVGITTPRWFEPARSRTATVSHPGGGIYQLVAYDADSPDA